MGEGTLRASWETYEKDQGATFRRNSPSQSSLVAVGLFVVVGVAYFLAARFGVALGVNQGVPIFWPAAGVAVGAFITLGPNARLPVAAGMVVATVASGILVGRSISLTITFAFINTGEALLTAWLIERWFGRPFTLDTVRQVLGFTVASAVSEAIAAGGAGTVVHFLQPTTSSAFAWRLWFASCSLGIFTVAPLIIGLGEIVRQQPPRRELIEGTVGLATLAALSVFVISLPQSPWATALPVVLVLPVLLWIAVRCPPAFAAAAMFIVALAVFLSATFDVGSFADANDSDRTLATQTLVLAAALLALVLAALFAERRRSEAALKQGRERLTDAMAAGQVMAFEWDAVSGLSQRCENTFHILGLEQSGTASSPRNDFLRHVHPDDRVSLKTCIRELQPGNPSYVLSFRFVRPDGREVWLEETARAEFDTTGRLLRIKGLTRDITERKALEEDKNLLIAELDHRVKNVLATVSAVASRTQETSRSMADFVTALDGRIKSMATTHELLSYRRWHGIPLAELVQRELAPYATDSNTQVEGPDVILSAEAGLAIAMVLHELATNAAKFGALSATGGRVCVRWSHKRNGHAHGLLAIHWEECRGPNVVPQTRSGYGTSVIRDLIPYELGGTVDLAHAPRGVRCRLEIPAHWLSGGNAPSDLSMDPSLRHYST